METWIKLILLFSVKGMRLIWILHAPSIVMYQVMMYHIHGYKTKTKTSVK